MAVHQTVIIGGGFGGLYAARSLKRAPVQATLVDRRNFHLFQPLLYQVATGALSPANIAAPLRAILRRQQNVRVLMAEVTAIDATKREVCLQDGKLSYDTLVVAAGVRHSYFGHDDWEPLAPGLKSIEDATAIRGRVLSAFESAECEPDPDKRRSWMTFIVVGAGPTGVELAGALGELSRYTLRKNFRAINPADAQILLLEGTDRVLPPFPPQLSTKAAAALVRLGVTIQTGTIVTNVREDGVSVRHKDQSEEIAARTVLWAAGVQASPLGQVLAKATGASLDRAGRVIVQPDLSISGHPEVFVIGDLAHCGQANGQPLPGVAQVAMQQGHYVARLIQQRLEGKTLPPFRYHDRGSMASIGRNAAVADLGWVYLSGFPARLIWLFIHVLYIAQFQNRLLVLCQWCWNYVTRNRSARLITDVLPESLPAPPDKERTVVNPSGTARP